MESRPNAPFSILKDEMLVMGRRICLPNKGFEIENP